MHSDHFRQGEGGADVGVDDEEFVEVGEDGVAEVVETAGGSEGSVFSEVAAGKKGADDQQGGGEAAAAGGGG